MSGPVDRNLVFVSGPEHQRIKQTVTSGTKSGTTWYLDGEDPLGLSFKKELLASGITENNRYVSSGGMVLVMFVQRTGTLGSVDAKTTNYFRHDHLGSMVAVSNETGAVVERMRLIPGASADPSIARRMKKVRTGKGQKSAWRAMAGRAVKTVVAKARIRLLDQAAD